jgi:hypothetical protein
VIGLFRSSARVGWWRFLWFPITFAAWLGLAATGAGQQIVRVEEDWEMSVAQPDAAIDAPQVACVMSPYSDVSLLNAAFTLNHRSLPSFAPGGLQLQVWIGDYPLMESHSWNTTVMSAPTDLVRWTQSMSLASGNLVFEVSGGTSTTWGSFGRGPLTAALPPVISDLRMYDPGASASNSGILYAANRVQWLLLRRVRWITADGIVYQDDTPRFVHIQE